MKHLYLYPLGLFLSMSFVFPTFSFSLPERDFYPECFKNYEKIDKSLITAQSVYKLDINSDEIIVFQSGKLLALKRYEGEGMTLGYSQSFDVLNDENPNTFLTIDTEQKKVFEVELIKKTQANKFYFRYDIPLQFHTMNLFISTDAKKYSQVSPDNIQNFSFQYLKVEFIPLNSSQNIRENIEIRELAFRSKNKTFLVETLYNDNLEIYSGYTCKQNLSLQNPLLINPKLSTKTPILYAELFANPKYNTTVFIDTDNDWIPDSTDNCVSYYNSLQQDQDGDGTGDMCSDQDRDGTLGYFDNCPTIYNPKQLDINKNIVGDACEFDKDKDGIYDSIDNAISKSNPDQKDTDRDAIGDVIDNCSLYNPTQSDIDQNQKGDVCDEQELKLLTQDKDDDGVLDQGDNCKQSKNPDQKDSDEDGVGDSCDMCKELQDPLQKDINKNKIGDLCEDTDGDGFQGYLDNCMYFSNSDQKDTDNDSVGDICQDGDGDEKVFVEDNCPFAYNPNQENIDKDMQGDICDNEDNRFLESNRYLFIGVMICVIALFLGAFFFMFRKIQK